MGDRWIILERFEFMLPFLLCATVPGQGITNWARYQRPFLTSFSLSLIWSCPRARPFCPNPLAQNQPQSRKSHYTFSTTYKALLVSSSQSTNRIQERWTAEVHLVRSRTEASVPEQVASYALMYQPWKRLQFETLLN
jgi:hypothetical protein